jgi:hypothetical protein
MATLRGGGAFEAKLRQIAESVSKPGTLRVGFLQNATYPDGKQVAMIAAIQDFGAPGVGIPPRPFFRNMIAAKQSEWPNAIGNLLKTNNYDAPRALSVAGAGVAGQLRQSIIETNSPPLSPTTIARKGHAKPLVDTGHMLNSVDFEVKTR